MISPAAGVLLIAMVLLLVGAFLSMLLGNHPTLSHRIAYVAAAMGSLVGLLGSAMVLWSGTTLNAELFPLAPLTTYTVHIDPLSAIFMALTSFIGFAVSLYALGYAEKYVHHKRVGYLGALYNLFLLSMGLVPAADNVLGFLLTWELMALLSFFLVAFDHEQPETRRASIMYAAMTQLGTGFLVGAFLLMVSHAHGFAFADLRVAALSMPPALKSLAFVGFLIGFGAKAGMFPLHGWLPEAHPAAPAHVSALMSAVMIKTGLYGLIRVAFDLLGGGPQWWGLSVLTLGAITAVLGAFYAVVEGDLKRLLAHSSIENIGIVLIGIGTAMLLHTQGLSGLALMALVASVFHLVNHACFKSLLFCGAGSVQYATHTRNLESLGGLIRTMPGTALLFLIGAVSLAALPPTNGFASEWLILQSLVAGARAGGPLLRILLPLALGALALTSGLALVASVKAFAVGFLAVPRSKEAAEAREVPVIMRVGMTLPAIACAALGLFSGWFVPAVASALSAGNQNWLVAPTRLFAPIDGGLASLSLPVVALLLGGVAVVAILTMGLGLTARVREVPTWGCGAVLSARSQYSAQGFSQPLRAVLGRWLLASAHKTLAEDAQGPYFSRKLRYILLMRPITEKWLYEPLSRWVVAGSRQITRLQSGNIHLYLAYIFVVLLMVLFGMRWIG